MTANGVYIGTDATERWTTAEFSTEQTLVHRKTNLELPGG